MKSFSALRQLSTPLILIPAYGAVYRTKEAMLAAWEGGADFKMYGSGSYCSVRDLPVLLSECSSLHLTDPRNNVTIQVD